MISNKYLILVSLLMMFSCTSKQEEQFKEKDYTKYVNPFIGTDGTGHTFPGPTRPFSMVQPSPDNTSQGWDYTSGYQLKDSTILGFSQTHMSGTGISEFGDVLLLPFENQLKRKAKQVEETASVGYYKVVLDDDIEVELTSTDRVAFHQYRYKTNHGNVFLNLQHGLRFIVDSLDLVMDAEVSFDENKRTISGYAHTHNWVDKKYFYVIEFDQPYQTIDFIDEQTKEKAKKVVLHFDLKDHLLKAKIALSSVSEKGAKQNMMKELPHWNFDQVVADSKSEWNKYLSLIEIEGDIKQMENFYTGMYHLFIQPSNICDVDGQYRGADDKIHQSDFKEYYSTLSLWDTYRAAHPLYTILTPERVDGFVNTMLLHHKAAGFLPIWTAWGHDNYCMIGNHSIPVIVDAYNKGFTGFDSKEALAAMVETSTQSHINSNWEMYNKYGYYPYDLLDNEAVSRTLESGFDDYCVSLMAESLGEDEIAKTFKKRASYYKNLFDKETGLMRGKDIKGNFRTPFEPLKPTSPMNNPGDYTEANAWQYTWTPMQYDVNGYLELLGGKNEFTKLLDTFFTLEGHGDNKHLGQEALIGQYAHGNEPSHHIAYLYAYTDKAERGEQLVDQIYKEFYHNTPDGITGNDDCGQMSAWYIFTTLGFYPVNSANATFTLMKPQTNHVIVNLHDNKKLEIVSNVKEGESVSKITLNGEEIKKREVSYHALMKGGVLKFD
ncbi:GH92 family glycosyl hydrolase [Flammeovirga yaeyamensis]|uniref:GH92 family glycosyl hydrolase n=1 Tax=Flammeovirga yaeyamensis TaxID=367791 RepID=A0AAX1NE75_9BACT|nr:GH92 family glycosyl hydrolase [Flammeovirga yaeyamensis]MBB3697278.1 putative alpha-1,2-mannosidase [Flammeovirga yaeyamensis]NMF33935.1 glycoside hydrolase family 92 protein [Flammeovirga yaeyamensis]QWG04805.1 GH92 family glycosyl hydrolase [Flammeovirga yaeyamensis]